MSEYNMPKGTHDEQNETGRIEIPPHDYTHEIDYADSLAEARRLLTEADRSISLLKRQRDYLARNARIPARVVHVDYDPAGDTTEYDADTEALELFGETALFFVIGCGPTPTHYSLITKELKP